MKVLKKGRKQKGWSTEATCTGTGNGNGGCGARLLVEQADLFKTYRNCLHETDTFITFKCSACGVLTDLKEFSVPSHLHIAKSQSEWEALQRPPIEETP